MNKLVPFGMNVTIEGDFSRVAFSGSITEEAKPALTQLAQAAPARVVLDLERVTFINSCGIRDWAVFLKALRVGRDVAFDRVPDELVRTMNMVLNFHARLPVRSLFRAYTCIDCGA